ncbi:apolipoprotein C-II-like [Mobula hypostoma]|uniref:apolipoprotein C-II-like n=1 Tax=Mobula hypostoma TaxID=723540 RepID=UPI002FC3B13F
MGMKVCGIVLTALLLALVHSDTSGPRQSNPPDEESLASTLRQYWDTTYNRVSQWVDSLSESTTAQYIRSAFNGSSAALATYTKVFFDQVMHMV